MAKKCFTDYPDLQFKSTFLSDCDLKFSNELATNYQKAAIANIILSKYGRAKTKSFAQNASQTKGVELSSAVFYFIMYVQIFSHPRML